MQHDFWHEKWQTNNIGFHQSQPHPLLTQHLKSLNLTQHARIFVPLCGKSLDISWLIEQGYHVIGIDLSPIAIQAVISDLALNFNKTRIGNLTHYQHPQIDLFIGDFFELTAQQLSHIDAVYDRAALIALPESMRSQYTQHLIKITDQAPQLLISLEYDQEKMDGPPFAIPQNELLTHYSATYHIQLLATVAEQLKGKVDAQEQVWLLDRLSSSK